MTPEYIRRPLNPAAEKQVHRNTKYSVLHDKTALENLMKTCGTPTRIAEHIGCGRSTAAEALKKFGIKRTGYIADDSVRKRLRLN